MRNIHKFMAATVIFTFLATVIPAAEGAGYIKFDGIDGESKDKDHSGWIDLSSLNQSIIMDVAESGTNDVSSGNLISFTKELDKSSPKIMESVTNGKVFPKVEIQLCRSSESVCYYQYQLENVMVSSYSVSTDDVPMEEISLNFEKIQVTLKEILKDGTEGKTAEFEWNAATGETKLYGELVPPKESDFNADIKSGVDVSLPEVSSKTEQVPSWIKNNARWWADDQIGDSDFILGIQHLVQEKVIVIETLPEQALETAEENVPDWVRNNADWWSQDLISEKEFLNAIKYLIENGIIVVGN